MTSPFDFAKSVTHTKESLYTHETLFQKEYVPFMVNRALSNSPQTALFADAVNQYPYLDKKLQYDFYMHGIPKQRGYSKWFKKEEESLPQDAIDFVCEQMGVSVPRAIEIITLLGVDVVKLEMDAKGGRQKK